MNEASREWFDKVYDYCEDSIPFGLAITSNSDDISFFLEQAGLEKELFDVLKYNAQKLQSTLPSEVDFAEEKERIFKILVPELQKLFPFAHSAITFWSVQWDIDICLLTDQSVSEDDMVAIINASKITKKYPLLDTSSLVFFLSKNLDEFAEKILRSRMLATWDEELSEDEAIYSIKTLLTSTSLWWTPSLDELHRWIDKTFFSDT